MRTLLFVLAFFQTDEEALRQLDPAVFPKESERGKQLSRLLADHARARIREANERESKAWHGIRTRGEWEAYRDARIRALRASLGAFPDAPADLKVRATKRLEGEGYAIENLVFESRPGLLVTANLYVPASPPAAAPGILIIHSHHNPKTQGELQDMGILWARAGARVLVPDQLGHGERRQHPFADAASYPARFRPDRQDYWFRFNTAAQLSLIGESLVGWMAWDLMRGVDLLLARGCDPEKIILLGSVAGGGDPAGVTAALDPRISCVVPFNFGGPQPESRYPLPEDAETSFDYAGGGSWESTRNLRLSARDGFLPWVIVGSVAPRRIVHAHEFSWDRERDPVWKRYQKIHEFYGTPDRLAATTGRGRLSGKPPESTHCNNIGAEHRKGGLYAALERWYGIAPPEKEPQERRPAADLLCLTPDLKPRPLHEIAAGAVRKGGDWARLLGDIEPARDSKVVEPGKDRYALEAGGITIPFLLLRPAREGRRPVVVAFGQEGKAGFLRHRASEIARLLEGGAAVCLADLRGTGETRAGDSVGRTSSLTSISATELMLGETLLGGRLKDLRTLLAYLRSRTDVDGARLSLWGDSFAPVNAPDRRVEVPWDAEALPAYAHPMGAMTALFAMHFEKELCAAYGRGGLESFAALLKSPFLYVPHDAMLPGALTAGDLGELARTVGSRILLEGSVDGVNRAAGPAASTAPAAWLLEKLR